MTKYQTRFRGDARSELRKIPRLKALNILHKLAELEQDPYAFGTTALVGTPELRRLRVGDYRVIYTIEANKLLIWVIDVGHRSEIYRRFPG